MKEYLSSLEDVLKEQNSSAEGLTTGEAQSRLSKYGKNELKKGKKTSLVQRFLKELADPDVYKRQAEGGTDDWGEVVTR